MSDEKKTNRWQVFYVMALLQPTKKERKDDKAPEVVMEPTLIVAKSAEKAAMKAIMGNSVLNGLDQDRLDLVIRPF